jgi:hypothetical protein
MSVCFQVSLSHTRSEKLKIIKNICFVFFSFVIAAGISSSLQGEESFRPLRDTFQAHCIKCHGKGGKVKGKVNLLELKSTNDLMTRPELLETLVAVLHDREMPPEDELALEDADRKQMVDRLREILGNVASSQAFIPVPMRRMNRFQYNNSVVDLLELDRDVFQLNERLMRRRSDYFNPSSKKMPPEVRVSSRPLSKDVDNQRPEGFRGVSVFPQDKRAEHGFDNRADHLTISPLLMESFLKLSQTIAGSPDINPKECHSWNWLFATPGQSVRDPLRGRLEAEDSGQFRVVKSPTGPAGPQDMKGFGNLWSNNAQWFWQCQGGGKELSFTWTANEEATGLLLGLTKARDYGIFEIYLDGNKTGPSVNLYDPKVRRMEHEVVASIKPGLHTITFNCVGKDQRSTRFFFGLDNIDLKGLKPLPKTPENITRHQLIRDRLTKLLRRAFRRPADAAMIERFTKFAEQQIVEGASWEVAMRRVVSAVLGMPDFFYFYETPNPDEARSGRQRINDFELASRLAQFFWSSIPDDTLLNLAETGRLSEFKVLDEQIDRMLNDKKISRFADNFPGQWLQLDRLITSMPDPKLFPYFYYQGYRTSMHMMSEPLLLFETVLVEDRSVMELLVPDFTWESSMLTANYAGHNRGGGDVKVQTFRRVPVTGSRRGGVITSAAVLTMTSSPSRTQPITRGTWVNAVIFNDPPEPPPADVPPLDESSKEELAKLTIRERLAAHRKRADCAGCHNQIDPFGFALENFGPTGVWRDKYANDREVDVSGILFNQHKFTNFDEFNQLIGQQKPRFVRGFLSHLLSYALCRDLGPADTPAIEAMTAQALTGQDQLRSLLKAIALSEPFLHKNTLIATRHR